MAEMLHPIGSSDQALPLDSWKERIRTVPGMLTNGSTLFPFDEAERFASEQYRLVRTKMGQGSNPQVLAVSSPQLGDGKTVTALNLAAALAIKTDSGVLLVDADLRRSSISKILGIPPGPGLRDVLRGNCALEDAIVQVQLARNLFVLPAGEEAGNPAELFDGLMWQQTCRDVRANFQSVVIDTTPVGIVADYELVQAAVDGVILVVRPDYTNRSRFYKALKLITQEKLVGVICNCVPKSVVSGSEYRDDRYYQAKND